MAPTPPKDKAPDQLYSVNILTAGLPTRCKFNVSIYDNSDPYPLDDQFVFFSSTRPDPDDASDVAGDYDLYIGDSTYGAAWPLTRFNAFINSGTQNELGVTYTPVIASTPPAASATTSKSSSLSGKGS